MENIRYKIARIDAWDVSLNVILMASRGIDFEREKEFVSKALSTVAKTESSRDTIVVSSNSLRQQIPCVVYASPNYRVSYGNVG